MNAVHMAAPPPDAPGLIFDLFSGPGGWDLAAEMLGLPQPVGLETDADACATRRAAGLPTIRYDVADFPIEWFTGQVWAIIASPVCTTFSSAGGRAGVAILAELAAAIRDAFAGRKTRAQHRRAMAAVLRKAGWPIQPPERLTPAQWRKKRQSAFKNRLQARAGKPAVQRRAVTNARPAAQLTRAQQSARIWDAVRSAGLVVEPARYIAATWPEWVALEQVPEVLPLWEVYAAELRKHGYHVWCGVLNAADYGVPQTRRRAILIASRTRRVGPPPPTHYDARQGMTLLFGAEQPWVSMAEALGIGATGRPAPTVTGGGTAQGGAEPFGRRDREALEAEREAGRWVLRRSRGEGMLEREGRGGRRDHPVDEPAPTITGAGGKVGANLTWTLHTNRDQRPDGTRQTADPHTAPAPPPALTSKSGGQWVLRRQVGASLRAGRRDHPVDEPAPTITGDGSGAGSGNGSGLEWVQVTAAREKIQDRTKPRGLDEPSHTITFGHADMRWKLRNNNNNACERSMDEPAGTLFFGGRSNWAGWVRERPATTVQGDPRVGRPGHKDRDKGESQFAQESERITVEQAACLQSFPDGYPWQGSRTAQFTQVGNAVPPLLAYHVLAEATGWPAAELAADAAS